MGGVMCCIKRKTNDEVNENEKDTNNFNINLNYNFNTNNKNDDLISEINENNIKEVYLKAVKDQNIRILIKLIENKSKIIIECDDYSNSMISKPETLGDLSAIKVFYIIQTRIQFINKQNENSNILKNEGEVDYILQEENKNEFEFFINELKETKLVTRLIKLFESDSCTKKDISILILSHLSSNKQTLILLIHKELIQKLIYHINSFRDYKYKNSSEHIIASLQILRRIYVKNVNLRKSFLELGGFQLLYENIMKWHILLIQEVLYNIEDLIYVQIDL